MRSQLRTPLRSSLRSPLRSLLRSPLRFASRTPLKSKASLSTGSQTPLRSATPLQSRASKETLANRCLLPRGQTIVFPNLGPTPLIAPRKVELLMSLVEDYITDKMPDYSPFKKYKILHAPIVCHLL
ncbi:hypothetical protein TKK_0016533 [Trichogramma kaykai]